MKSPFDEVSFDEVVFDEVTQKFKQILNFSLILKQLNKLDFYQLVHKRGIFNFYGESQSCNPY